jgi:filamentous hemagglutinin family protein
LPTTLIEGGAARGSNLFHSFQEFNVNTGQAVYFANPIEIENILTRVTGGNLSSIDGLLGVDGAANLFLLNPNGFIFGPNATLDINGSFLTSTGSSFTFADGSAFNAPPMGDERLSVSVPLGVQFNDQSQGNIVIRNSNLSVSNNLAFKSLRIEVSNALISTESGDISLETPADLGSSISLGGAAIGQFLISKDNARTSAGSVRIISNSIKLEDSAVGSLVSESPEAKLTVGDTSITGTNIDITNSTVGSLVSGSPETTLIAGDMSITGTNINITNSTVGSLVSGSPGAIIDIGKMTLESQNFTSRGGAIGTAFSESITADADNITLKVDSLQLLDESQISSTILGLGNTERIWIEAKEIVLKDKSLISSSLGKAAEGDSAGIAINTDSLSLSSGSRITTQNSGIGNAGLIEINADSDVTVAGYYVDESSEQRRNSSILSQVFGTGNSDGIIINSGNLNILDGAGIGADTVGKGNSGSVQINAQGTVLLSGERRAGISSTVAEQATGSSAGIVISSNELIIKNGLITASTSGEGNAGRIQISTEKDVRVSGNQSSIASNVTSKASGNSEGIFIRSANLFLSEGAAIVANTFGKGDAGQIKADATESVVISTNAAMRSDVQTGGTGNSGGMDITANTLSIVDRAGLSTATFEQGNAGLMRLKVQEDMTLRNGRIISQVNSGAIGQSIGIELSVGSLSILEEGVLSVDTQGLGNSGTIQLQSRGDVVLNSGRLISRVTPSGEGDSGGITLSAQNLRVLNGSELASSTFGQGNSGAINIETLNTVVVDGASSQIASEVDENAVGSSEGIAITSPNLFITNSAVVSATAAGRRGTAGSIVLKTDGGADLKVDLAGDGLIAAETFNREIGGNLTINTTGNLTIKGSGALTVSSGDVNSGPAGDLNVFARSVLLDGGVGMLATISSVQGGGNINFDVDETLILRRSSFINAESTNETSGSGGNIDLDANFIIAVPNENSDIIANAFGGDGGRVEITAKRILGLTESQNLTTSELRDNATSDVSASSQFGQSGEVTITNLEFDPSQGLVELPFDLEDRASQITPGCGLGNTDDGSEFVVTGRGGLPPNPSDPLAANGVGVPWVVDDNSTAPIAIPPPNLDTPQPLVEAEGIAIDAAGNAYFVTKNDATVTAIAGSPSSYCASISPNP